MDIFTEKLVTFLVSILKYAVAVIFLFLVSHIIKSDILKSISQYILIMFFVFQYLVFVLHAKYLYIGKYRCLWILLLVIDPVGPFRISYIVAHVRRQIKSRYRYAYSKEPCMKKLKDLRANIFTGDVDQNGKYVKKPVLISQTPISHYLNTKDEKVFKKYHDETVKAKHKNYDYSLKKFLDLVDKIQKEGYKSREPYIKVKGDVISDGQHRASILYHLFGPEYEVDVVLHKDLNASV